MANFLSNKNLQEFVSSLKIGDEEKKVLTEKIPVMNKEERLELMDALKKVYLLDLEETKAIEKIAEDE